HEDRRVRPAPRRQVAVPEHRRRRQRVRLSRRLPRRALARRDRSDLRVRGRARARADGHRLVRRQGRSHDRTNELRLPVGRGARRDVPVGHGRRHAGGLRTARRAAREADRQQLISRQAPPTAGGPTVPKMQKIEPFLWFDDNAEEAAEFYVSLFHDSEITNVARYPEGSPGQAGSVMTVNFTLAGQPFIALNGGPALTFSAATS